MILPDGREAFELDEFLQKEKVDSKIRKDYKHEMIVGIKCPRCDNIIGDDFGKEGNVICKNCKLSIIINAQMNILVCNNDSVIWTPDKKIISPTGE
jgi:hypothetical protein